MNEWTGKQITKEVEQKIKQSCKAIKSRIIKPAAMVTEDYWPNRVNIHVDHQGCIIEIKMG